MRNITRAKSYGRNNAIWSEALIQLYNNRHFSFRCHSPQLVLDFYKFSLGGQVFVNGRRESSCLHLTITHTVEHLDGELPPSYRHDFTILTSLASRVDGSSKKQKSGISHAPALAKKDANDSSILCILFNTGVFSRSNCHSKYACNNCESKNNGSKTFNETSGALQI